MIRLWGFLSACSLFVGGAATPNALPNQPVREAQIIDDGPHVPPVDAPIIDVFRPPPAPWLAGNRGLEYDTEPGQLVRASSAGTVTFAGQVGGDLFVTVLHGSGLRTTVAFVDHIVVATGDRVSQGTVLAVAGESMHFTARRNGNYIDPETLFWTVRVVVRLVDGPG